MVGGWVGGWVWGLWGLGGLEFGGGEGGGAWAASTTHLATRAGGVLREGHRAQGGGGVRTGAGYWVVRYMVLGGAVHGTGWYGTGYWVVRYCGAGFWVEC